MRTKKWGVILLIGGFLVMCSSAFAPPSPPPHESGLKVLPKDISHDDLMAVMKEFKRSLGFKCSDCHAKSTTDPEKLDFGADHPSKLVALDMMRMTMKINRQQFGIKGKFTDHFLQGSYKVSCYTCHHGNSTPTVLGPPDKAE